MLYNTYIRFVLKSSWVTFCVVVSCLHSNTKSTFSSVPRGLLLNGYSACEQIKIEVLLVHNCISPQKS